MLRFIYFAKPDKRLTKHWISTTRVFESLLQHASLPMPIRRNQNTNNSTLTLSALLAEGRSFEVSEKQAKGIEKSLAAIRIDEKLPTEIDDRVNAIQHQQRQRQQPPYARRETVKRKCYYCGLDYPHKNNTSCPAYGKECSFCHKMNHFAKVCKSSQNRDQNKFPRQPRSSRQFNNSSINTVNRQHTNDESNSSSEDEYIYTVNTSSAVTSKDNLTAKLKINRTNFQALIDTGASINIIDETLM